MAKISIPAAICLLISLALFYFLYSTGKKRFARMVAPLDEKLFRVKSFMPAGFALMALLKYDYRSNFDRKLRQQIAEIHEPESLGITIQWIRPNVGSTKSNII